MNLHRLFLGPLKDITNLLLPPLCPACRQKVLASRAFLCPNCQLTLPETHYHQKPENRFMEHFYGRITLAHGAALYFFNKSGLIQQLLFEIKYRGRHDLATYLGFYFGKKLTDQPAYSEADMIIPVPLHAKKLRKRGFNQSTAFAKGLSRALNIPVHTDILSRVRHTGTQTRKSRMNRIRNVEKAFVVKQPDQLLDRHVILVDDVLTTGATLEACARTLLKAPGLTLSMLTIAIAES